MPVSESVVEKVGRQGGEGEGEIARWGEKKLTWMQVLSLEAATQILESMMRKTTGEKSRERGRRK